jgi:hypothetical protein
LIVFVATVFIIHCLFYRPFVGFDDANINQVYAANILHGHGWVYHPGTERVEGTTSFLQTLIWVIAFWTPYPVAIMHVIQLVFCILSSWSALCILTALHWARRGNASIDLAVFGYFFWLGLNPELITWTTITLMDASLWTLLLLLAVWSICRFVRDQRVAPYSLRMSALALALVLTRPESLALVPVLLAVGGFIAPRGGRSSRAVLRAVAFPFLVYATAAAGLTLFRLKYFGYPLPNTYYAKLSPHFWYNVKGGIWYVYVALQICPLAIPMLAAAFLLLFVSVWRLARRTEPSISDKLTIAVLLPAMALLGIAVVNGGDHFGQGRFLVQFNTLLPIPLLALLDTPRWLTAGRRAVGLGIVCVVLAVGIDLLQVSGAERVQPISLHFRIAEDGIEAGRLLSRAFPDGKATLGVTAAGGIARSYQGYIIDLLGLNNTLIAHSNQGLYGLKNHAGFSRPVFYRLKPDLVFPRIIRDQAEFKYSCSSDPGWEFLMQVTRGLLVEPEFTALYEPEDLLIRSGANARRDDLLVASPAFLRGLMESAPQPALGIRVFVKRSMVASVARDVFDVHSVACGPPAPPIPKPRPPQIRFLAWLDGKLLR